MDPTQSFVSVPVDGSHSAIHHASATIYAVIHTSVSIPLMLGESLSVVDELRAELNSCVDQWLSKRAEIERLLHEDRGILADWPGQETNPTSSNYPIAPGVVIGRRLPVQ